MDGGGRLRQPHAKVIERIPPSDPHAVADGGGDDRQSRRVDRRSGAGHWQVMECNALSGGAAGTEHLFQLAKVAGVGILRWRHGTD